MANDDEVFKNFLIEIAERLAEFDQGLRELEQAYNVNHINLLFRAIHTIKGGAGFFGLNKITELTHLLEDLLMKIREGDVAFDAAMMPALYAASDCLNDMQQDASYGEQMDISCMHMSPIFIKQAVPELWVQRIETAIIRSDFTLTPHNHQRVQGVEFEWNQAWFNVLLNEADILPSSTPALGPSLSEALSREWMTVGFEAYKTVATAQGREIFLRSLLFSSAASRVLQASQRRQAQLEHAHVG